MVLLFWMSVARFLQSAVLEIAECLQLVLKIEITFRHYYSNLVGFYSIIRSKHCDYSVVTMSIAIGKAVHFSVLLQTLCNLL